MDNSEKYIAKKIRDHREEMDMEDLWMSVSPHIPKEKKKHRAGFWIFGGIMLVLVMSIGWVLNTEDELNKALFSNQKEKKTDSVNKNEDQATDTRKSVQTELEGREDKTQIESTTQNPTNEENIIRSNGLSNLDDRDEVSMMEQTASYAVKTLPESLRENEASILIEKDDSVRSSLFLTENPNVIIETKSSEQIISKKKYPVWKMVKPLENIPFAMIQSRKILPEPEIENVNINPSLGAVGRWDVYILGGAALATRNLRSKSTELQNERNRREGVVDVLGAWEVEGGIGFRLSPKLKIRTGFNYTQIHERAMFESDYLVDFEVQENSLIQRQDGSVESIIETSNSQGIRHSSELRYNQLRLWQIPVRLSYEVLTISKFKFIGTAMASYSFALEYKGFTSLSASQESYDLALDEAGKFRSGGAWSYGLFLEGSTHLTRMLDISLGVGYRRIGNINSETYLIDQQYNLFSVTSGLSHRF